MTSIPIYLKNNNGSPASRLSYQTLASITLNLRGLGPKPCHPRNKAVLRGYINRKNPPNSGRLFGWGGNVALDNPRPLRFPWWKVELKESFESMENDTARLGKEPTCFAKLLFFSDKHLELSKQKWKHWISRFGDLFDVSMMFSG